MSEKGNDVREEIRCNIPFKEEVVIPLVKAEVSLSSSDPSQRDIYLTFVVSDTALDVQNDIMSRKVLEKMVEDAKKGKIRLTRGHDDHFTPGVSVDGFLKETEDGRVEAYITFKANKPFGQFYPEVLEILETYQKQGSVPYQVSVGGWIYKYDRVLTKEGVRRIITDAEVEHVGIIRQGMAANPRTRLVDALVKAISFWEKDKFQKEEDYKPEGDEVHLEFKVMEEDIAEMTQTMEPMRKSVNDLWLELEKISVEARKIRPYGEDLLKQAERSKKYGINPTPVGSPVKPELYLEISEEDFADPVNYLFPVTEQYAHAVVEFFHQNPHYILSLYDINSARNVYNRALASALNYGPVPFTDSPIIGLGELTYVSQMEGFVPDIYYFNRNLLLRKDDWEKEIIAGLWVEIPEVSEDEAVEILKKRSEVYGYEPSVNAHIKKHPVFEEIPEGKFADPVGLNFPITPEWILKSYRVFMDEKIRSLYSPKAQKEIFSRILKGMKRLGYRVPFNPNDHLFWVCYDPEVMVGADDFDEQEVELRKKESMLTLHKSWEENPLRRWLVKEEVEKKVHVEMRKEGTPPDMTLTAEQFIGQTPLFVMGLTRLHPGAASLKTDELVLTALSDIGKWEEIDLSSPFVVIKKVSEIAKFLGLKDPSVIFGDAEKVTIRYVPVDGKEIPVPKTEKEEGKEPSAVAKLSIMRKETEEPLIDVYLLRDGSLYECVYLRGVRPISFRKDHVPELSLLRAVSTAVARALGVDERDIGPVLELGRHFVVVSSPDGPTMFPYFIDEEGNIIIENAPKKVFSLFIPEDEDVELKVYGAILDMYINDDRVSEEWKSIVREEVESGETPSVEEVEEKTEAVK